MGILALLASVMMFWLRETNDYIEDERERRDSITASVKKDEIGFDNVVIEKC